MNTNKVLHPSQLPKHPSIGTPVLACLLLDRLQASQLIWGICLTLLAILFILQVVSFWHQQTTKIKELLLLPILVLFALMANCQEATINLKPETVNSKFDTVIQQQAYTSYFSYHYHNPVAVTYKLYHGGGNCSRATFRFKNDIPGLPCAHQHDYAHNGYDEGHLCDAADMAFNCTLDESTFRFYNCVPQTPNLNRGSWKHWETQIRKESQTDSLFIEAGNIFGTEFIGDSVYIPAMCYKVVTSLTTGAVMHVIICSNDAAAECKEVSYEALVEALEK